MRNVYNIPERCRRPSTKHSQRLLQRISILRQSLNTDLQCSPYKSNWPDIDPTFKQEFNLASSTFDLNGTSIQHTLQKEFHAIAQKTAQVRKTYSNNAYVQELVKRNVTCIQRGIACNQEGKVIQAAQFADIGWAILDHIQALGEGIGQGTGNIVHAFFHPISTVQGITQAICTITSSLRQATLEVVNLCILGVTDQNAADKKLQAWKQNFTTLMDTIQKQLQETPNRDITKFISSFGTEIFLTGKVGRGLGSFFSFTRTKATNLIARTKTIKLQDTTGSFIRQAQEQIKFIQGPPNPSKFIQGPPKGIAAQVNKVVKYTEGASKTGPTVKQTGATRLRKTGGPIKEKALQIRQSRQPAKTGNPAKQNPGTRLQKKPEAIKEQALQRRSPQQVPKFVRDNRVPLDRETILNDSTFKGCNARVKGAKIYKKNNLYYHRDTFHTGNSAHLEVYNKRGIHIGKANPTTGEIIANTADKTKKINI